MEQTELFSPEETNENVLIYESEDGQTRVDVVFERGSVWLSQIQMADLYGTGRSNIIHHIKNIFEEGELDSSECCRLIPQYRQEGRRQIKRDVLFYNLDMIISLGYRVRSRVATRFRKWATARLNEYLVKGFTMDDERLKNNGGGTYWHELLARIKDIRSSEKVLYRQVLDLYATSVDYDPSADTTRDLFKMVQNKLHYATHGNTAAEIIYGRADADKPFMGLTSFSGPVPSLKDVRTAKNYLSDEELRILNNLVSAYFDFAEIQAIRRKHVYMADYVRQLDMVLTSTGQPLLTDGGRISHEQALEKAEQEYRKYQVKSLSPIELAYADYVKELHHVTQTNTQKK